MAKLALGKGKVEGLRILITGASSGIGRALARGFLEDGAAVAVCARREKALAPLREAGAAAFYADVSEKLDVDALVRGAVDALGGLDVAINNAAVLPHGRLTEQPLEDWRRVLETNLTGPLLVARACAEVMERGAVVNITSGLGFFAMEPYNAYCVSKAGLNMMTRALALEWDGRLAVNAVDPGEVRSEMNPAATQEPDVVYPVVRALAAAGPDGPTGKCFKKSGEEVPWG